MIFDTHAHYDDEAFDNDRDALIAGLPAAGIGRVVNIAASPGSIDECLELAHKYPHVYCALGIHPEHCADMTEELLCEIREKLSDPKAVAVGEIGLDYYWPEPDQELQRHWFARQLQLAAEVDLPVVVHSREAAADTYRIMKENHAEKTGGVVHCYSYSAPMAKEFVKMGFYIGVGGVVTFKNSKKLKRAVESIPISNIVLETDSPYLAPVPFRGLVSHAGMIPQIGEVLAKVQNVSVEDLMEQVRKNTKNCYGI